MMNNLVAYHTFIEQALREQKLPQEPKNLYEPIHYFLDLGGKRLRPILTLMAHELFAGNHENAKAAALCIELFHNFSLIHDDVMDKAPLRRGQETVHKKWNENIAILAGDQLLIEAYKQLATYPSTIQAKLIATFNQTATEVCEGQQMDMDFENRVDVSVEEYIEMIRLKTSVLVGCSLKLGGLVAECSPKDAENLYEFGVNIGIAFQLMDDLLDAYGSSEQLGKQIGGDIIANKKTYLLISALNHGNEAQVSKIKSLLHENDHTLKVTEMKAVFDELKVHQKSSNLMEFYHVRALQSLASIEVSDEKKEPLHLLTDFLLKRQY